MGAGVQRWWRDGSRYRAEVERDRTQSIMKICAEIVRSDPRHHPAIRRALAGLLEFWKQIPKS